MITQVENVETTASSCMAFVRSMQSRYREFVAAGDVTDRRPRRETGEAHQLYSAIIQRCHSGERPRAVCEDLGVKLENFYAYCAMRRKMGDEGWNLLSKPRGRKCSISASTLAKAAKLRSEGLKWRQVGEAVGLPENTIRRAVLRSQK